MPDKSNQGGVSSKGVIVLPFPWQTMTFPVCEVVFRKLVSRALGNNEFRRNMFLFNEMKMNFGMDEYKSKFYVTYGWG